MQLGVDLHPVIYDTLQEDINQRYNEHGPVQTIFSATIPEQAVAIHIFNTLGYTHTHTIEIWPSYAALGQYEDAAGVTLSIHPPGMEFVQALPSMIDFLGGQESSIGAACCVVIAVPVMAILVSAAKLVANREFTCFCEYKSCKLLLHTCFHACLPSMLCIPTDLKPL